MSDILARPLTGPHLEAIPVAQIHGVNVASTTSSTSITRHPRCFVSRSPTSSLESAALTRRGSSTLRWTPRMDGLAAARNSFAPASETRTQQVHLRDRRAGFTLQRPGPASSGLSSLRSRVCPGDVRWQVPASPRTTPGQLLISTRNRPLGLTTRTSTSPIVPSEMNSKFAHAR